MQYRNRITMVQDEYESREDLMITKFGKKKKLKTYDDMIARQMKTYDSSFICHHSAIQDSRS